MDPYDILVKRLTDHDIGQLPTYHSFGECDDMPTKLVEIDDEWHVLFADDSVCWVQTLYFRAQHEHIDPLLYIGQLLSSDPSPTVRDKGWLALEQHRNNVITKCLRSLSKEIPDPLDITTIASYFRFLPTPSVYIRLN